MAADEPQQQQVAMSASYDEDPGGDVGGAVADDAPATDGAAADQDHGGAATQPSPQRTPQRARSSPGPHGSPNMNLATLSQSMGSLHSKKAAPTMATLSQYRTGPASTMAGRVSSGSFFRSSSTPGPGTYAGGGQQQGDTHSKYKSMPRYSFGGCSRFGLGANPTKEKPGPGHYGVPKDPGAERAARTSFGGGNRGSLAQKTDAPGPGAYELKTSLGDGRMCTAGGRHYGSSVRSRMQPGPGAYDPMDRTETKFHAPPKVGFGTSTREDFSLKREAGKPGPGTYEMANARGIGKDAAKFSIRSRRRMHDLASYIEPGPGHYASHATSFMATTSSF